MRKFTCIFLAVILSLMCCSCQKAQQNTFEFETESETESQITVEQFVKMTEGMWVRDNRELLYIYDTNFETGVLESYWDRECIIESVEKIDENSFELTLCYPETIYYEEYYPEESSVVYVSSEDNFTEELTLLNQVGDSYTYTYSGKTIEDVYAKLY